MNITETLKQIRGKETADYTRVGPYTLSVNEENTVYDYHFSCPVFTLDGGEEISAVWRRIGKKLSHDGINCKTVLYGDKVTIQNYIGKATVSCADLTVFPAMNGIKIISRLPTVTFRLKTDGSFGLITNNTGVALMMAKHYPFLTVSGLTAYSEREKRRVPVLVETKEKKGGYDIELYTEYGDAAPEAEINLYFPKLILDTCPESRYPDKRNPYGAAVYLGHNPYTWDGELYSRLNMAQPESLRPWKIISAKVYMYTFERKGEVPVYSEAMGGWCSFNMDWSGRKQYSDKLSKTELSGNYLSFDITETVRSSFGGETFVPGVVLRGGDQDSFAAVATADCYSYPQILEIRYQR